MVAALSPWIVLKVNTSPEFKGIKTALCFLPAIIGEVNTSPEFKGIKTNPDARPAGVYRSKYQP